MQAGSRHRAVGRPAEDSWTSVPGDRSGPCRPQPSTAVRPVTVQVVVAYPQWRGGRIQRAAAKRGCAAG